MAKKKSFWRRRRADSKAEGHGDSAIEISPSEAGSSPSPSTAAADLPDVPAFAALRGEVTEQVEAEAATVTSTQSAGGEGSLIEMQRPSTQFEVPERVEDEEDEKDEAPVLFGSLPVQIAEEGPLPAVHDAVGETERLGQAGDQLLGRDSELIPTPSSEVSEYIQESLGSLEVDEIEKEAEGQSATPGVGWRDEPEQWDSEEEAWKEITAEWAREDSMDERAEAPASSALSGDEATAEEATVAYSPDRDAEEAAEVAPLGEVKSEAQAQPETEQEGAVEADAGEGVQIVEVEPQPAFEGGNGAQDRAIEASDAAESPLSEEVSSVAESPVATESDLQPSGGSLSAPEESPDAGEEAPAAIEESPDAGGEEPSALEAPAGPSGEAPAAIEESPDLPRVAPEEEHVPVEEEAGEKRRSLPVAVLTGLIFGAVALALLLAGPVYFAILAFVLIVVAEIEFVNAVRKSGFQPAAILILLGTVLAFVSTGKQGAVGLGFSVVAVLAAASLWYALGIIKTAPIANLASTVFGFCYLGVAGALALTLMGFPNPSGHWRAVVTFPVAVAIASDVGGYLGGSRFGRHFIVRSISPRKSIEGYISGLILALVVAFGFFLAGRIFEGSFSYWTLPRSFIGAAVVFVSASLGDLAESLLKRSLDIKDMSSILPGHGGMLDRIDSLLAVVPAFTLFLYFSGT